MERVVTDTQGWEPAQILAAANSREIETAVSLFPIPCRISYFKCQPSHKSITNLFNVHAANFTNQAVVDNPGFEFSHLLSELESGLLLSG